MKIKYLFALLAFLLLGRFYAGAQMLEQDCVGAIPVCQNYIQSVSYAGSGANPDEINAGASCLSSGEKNGVWYKLHISQGGLLGFTLQPNDAFDDYDWAVYNVTNGSCADIAANASLEVSCNFSGTSGPTGANGGSPQTTQGAGGTPENAMISTQTGETYYLYVSNYSSSQSGYALAFYADTMGAASISGSGVAQINNLADAYCLPAEPFNLQATPAGGGYMIDGTPISSTFFNPSSLEPGLHTVDYKVVTGNCSFTTTETVTISPGHLILSGTVQNATCASCATGKITVTASGGQPPYIYRLNQGGFQASSLFSGLLPGVYVVTVRDAGGCETTIALTISNAQTCGTPANLTANPISAGAYLITWNSVPNAANYTLRYKPVSSSTWTSLTVSGTNRQIAGLPQQTEYEAQVRANCINAGAGGYTASVYFNGASSPLCNVPSPLTVVAVGEAVATLSWPAVPGATNYQIQYRQLAGGNWDTYVTPQTAYAISGLTPGVKYIARVRSVCGLSAGLWGATVQFTTQNGTRLGYLNNSAENADFTVYPNPSDGAFNVSFYSEEAQDANISLIDMTGRTVENRTISTQSGLNDAVLDFRNVSSGVYLVRWNQSEQSFTFRVTIRQ